MNGEISKRKVLIVDDEPQIRNNINILLTKRANLQTFEASNGDDALKIYKKERPEVVILDYNMPGITGKDVLKEIRKIDQFVQIIFLTARSEETVLAEILNIGANDYIRKPYGKTEILARVNSCLRVYNLTEELHTAVMTDDLTGLRNMRGIYDEIDQTLDKSYKNKFSLAIAMIDMDYFKTVNDGHDHLFGSHVLSECGEIIRSIMVDNGIGARFGGDEFMLVFPKTTAEEATTICNTLNHQIGAHLFQKNDDEITLTCSIGLAIMDPNLDRLDSQAIVRVADQALYDSKENGRNKVTVYSQNEMPDTFVAAINKGKILKHQI